MDQDLSLPYFSDRLENRSIEDSFKREITSFLVMLIAYFRREVEASGRDITTSIPEVEPKKKVYQSIQCLLLSI
jgi:hypothetical protein